MRTAILVPLLLAALAAPARADNEADARALFLEGNKLLERGDYVAALEKYERAHELFPAARILLNQGTTLRALGRNAEAASTYERYLAAPDADAKRLPEVRKILAELDAQVARLAFRVSEPDARVLVDGKAVVVPADGALRVDPGSHSIVAEKEGFVSAVATLDLGAGERRTVELELAPVKAPPPDKPVKPVEPVEPVPADDGPAPWHRDLLGWGLAGAGVVLLASSAGVQVSALSLHDDAVAALTPGAATDLQDRAESRQTLALVLGGAGVAVASAGIIKLVLHDRPREATPAAGGAAGGQARVRILPTAGGLVVQGRF